MSVVRHAFQIPHADTVLQGSCLSGGDNTRPRLLSLHGGGPADHRRMDYLLEPLAALGHSSAAFDFIGHGATGGELLGSSLSSRVEQARSVITGLKLPSSTALIGTSMGGHIACRLLDELAPRLLVLYCPAAYAPGVEHLAFGPEFQQALRSTSDFADSPAFAALERFRGHFLLVTGTADTIIPAQVIEQYTHRARQASSVNVVQLAGAGHTLHLWLQAHPQENARLQQQIHTLLNSTTAD